MLINGDCLEEMKKIESNKIDLLFCDLPWAATSCKWDCAIDLKLFWKEINRICKINCPMFFCCNAKFGNTLINSNPKNFRRDLIWVKSSPVGFLNCRRMEMRKHESIYVFYRKLPFYDLSSHEHKFIKSTDKKDKDELFIRGKDNNTENKDIYNYNERLKNGKLYHHSRKLQKGDEPIYDPPLPNSILEIKSEKGKHATQKPIKLIEWILKYYSKEGDTILDPTCGSGSSGVACKNMSREFIGIEKNEEIFKVAESRVNN